MHGLGISAPRRRQLFKTFSGPVLGGLNVSVHELEDWGLILLLFTPKYLLGAAEHTVTPHPESQGL